MQGIITLLAVIVLVFLATHAIGDPVRFLLPYDAPPDAVEQLRHTLGLDLPLHVQFGRYMSGVVQFDFGLSLWQGIPATELVLERLPRTMILAFAGMVFAVFIGCGVGTIAALRPGSILDRTFTTIGTLGFCAVDFWVGLMLILLVAVYFGLLPTSGYGDFKHLLLPAFTLGLRPMGRIAMIARPALIEELNKPYIVALRARGLSSSKVVLHACRNAGIVVLSLIGYQFAGMFTGATVLIETVFAWPGIGYLLVQGIINRDFPVVIAVASSSVILVVLIHLIVDLIYAVINPRVRYN